MFTEPCLSEFIDPTGDEAKVSQSSIRAVGIRPMGRSIPAFSNGCPSSFTDVFVRRPDVVQN